MGKSRKTTMAVTKARPRTVRRKGIDSGIVMHGPVQPIPDSVFIKGEDFASTFDRELDRPYANHAWVYAAIRAIATNISQVPLKVAGGPLQNPKIFDVDMPGPGGDLVRVLDTPNLHTTSYELWEIVATIMHLDGACAWILDRELVTQIPEEIYPVSTKMLQPVFDRGSKAGRFSGLLGWILTTPSGERIPLTPAQVLIFKFANPYDAIFGLSPLEAARRGVKLDYLAGLYGSSFFENSADPSGVIISERRLTRKQMVEIREFWEERHRGPGNAKKVGILYGGMKYQPLMLSQRDMEFIEQRRWTRDEILAVFKVPKSELSLYEDVNMATSLSQDKSFWMKTLVPIMKNFTAVLMSKLVPGLKPIIDPRLRIFFDLKTVSALQEQFSEKIKNAEKLARIGYPINIINEVLELGFPKVEWGDTWYVNQAILPIEMVLAGLASGAKPSHPSVDAPNGDVDEDEDKPKPGEDEDEGREEGDEEEEGGGPKKALIPSSLIMQAMDAASVSIKKHLHAYFWRLRRHQLGLIVREKVTFDRSVWDQKLYGRVSKSLNDAVAHIYGIAGRKPCSYTGETQLNKFIQDGVQTILDNEPDTTLVLDKVREFFNKVSAEPYLTILSKKEVVWQVKMAGQTSTEHV